MKKVAIICFTDYVVEPRVLRTIKALNKDYNLTLYSAGNTIDNIKCENITHLNEDGTEINFHQKLPAFFRKLVLGVLKIFNYSFQSTAYYKRQFWSAGRKEILERINSKKYDVVIGHGIYTLPILSKLNTKTVFNAHEYYLKEFEESVNWKKYTQPYYKFILDQYLSKVNVMFCVSKLIQDEYKKEYKINSVEITNATAFYDLKPIKAGSAIKIIHHGAAIRTRQLELMAETMNYLGTDYSLTFMLTPSDKEYLEELKTNYKNVASVRFLDPVPVNKIAEECNRHDIGLFILPPVNFNWYYALPNKLYEFIQGRLCVAVSPNPDMKRVVESNNLGVVSQDYTAESMAKEILKLTAEKINYHKEEANKTAHVLNAEVNQKIILEEIEKLVK